MAAYVPSDIAENLNINGRKLADTDWHINRLYADLLPEVTAVSANFHRYVIDANSAPFGSNLYLGQNTTTLVPLTDFDGVDIWDKQPAKADAEIRRATFHTPYHNALQGTLLRGRDLHGFAILYDCHSIHSNIPFLFHGTPPDFNIGTDGGATCAAKIEAKVTDICRHALGYSSTMNGRFKRGWTTRHYGQPAEHIHAIQMELAQSTYLMSEAATWGFPSTRAW